MSGFLSQFSYVEIFNFCVFLIFTCCYTYQLFYVLVVLKQKPDVPEAKRNHRFAAVISARNESAVIGYLIKSIKDAKEKYGLPIAESGARTNFSDGL